MQEDLVTLLRQEGRTFCKDTTARRGLELLACAASLDAPCVPPAVRNNDAASEAPPTELPKRKRCPVKVLHHHIGLPASGPKTPMSGFVFQLDAVMYAQIWQSSTNNSFVET